MTFKPNDRVIFSQANLFEDDLLGKRGIVLRLPPYNPDKIVVKFDDFYVQREVDPQSLEKESKE